MIINTGQRTDIPAFFPEWFANRLREGYVCVRNPYNQSSVNKYILNPQVVDAIGFCTKNPAPFFSYLDLVKDYGQYWYVTITPYGKDIEPGVPDKKEVMESFKFLSKTLGINRIGWRYDPIFVNEKLHDVNSPFLIGGFQEGDIIHEANQKSWIDNQMSIFDLI